MGRTNRLLAVAVLGGLLIAASSAFGQSLLVNQAVNPARYRIIAAPESETGFLGSARGFNWVDSNRLLFLANDRELSATEKRGERTIVKRAVATIHLWDISNGTVRRYRAEPLAHYLCTVDGRVWYGLSRTTGNVFYEGRFGEERELPSIPDRVDGNGKPMPRGFNRFACTGYWYADVPRPNKGRSFPLRSEHGVLETLGTNHLGSLVVDGQLPPYKRWIHAGGKSLEVPFPQDRIGVPLKYSPSVESYLFARIEGRIARGMTNKFYLWKPLTNAVQALEVPGSQNWSTLYDADVVQLGIIAKSSLPVADRRAKWDPGPAGLYLLRGPDIDQFLQRSVTANAQRSFQDSMVAERVNRGLIDEISGVSPDGCRVAVVIDPYDREDRRIRLEMIDFCARGA